MNKKLTVIFLAVMLLTFVASFLVSVQVAAIPGECPKGSISCNRCAGWCYSLSMRSNVKPQLLCVCGVTRPSQSSI